MNIETRYSLTKLAWLEFVTPEVTGPTKRLAEKIIKKTIRSEVMPGTEFTQNVGGTVVVPPQPVLYPTGTPATAYEAPAGFDQKIASYRLKNNVQTIEKNATSLYSANKNVRRLSYVLKYIR